jgi:MFS family permease
MMLERIRVASGALATTARNRDLLRTQLSFGASSASEMALIVAIAVVAFRAGGALQVALITSLRMALPAVAAPVLSVLSDRHRRDRVLLLCGLVRTFSVALAAVLIAWGASLWAIYALVIIAACAFILGRAVNSALTPLLCKSPLELTSAMATRGLLDSLGTLVGPILAALVLAFGSPSAVMFMVAALSFGSSALLAGIRYEAPPRPARPHGFSRLLGDATGGLAAIAKHRDAAVLVALALVQTFTRGCFNVFVVILAFDLLRVGQAGVGVLTAAVGVGAAIASFATFSLVSSRHLAAIEGVGVALWGLPLVVSGAVHSEPGLLVLMAVIGIGNALVDVGLFTLLARLVPEQALGRVFGTFESLIAITVAIGALVTPAAVTHLGLGPSLALLGGLAPVAAAIAFARLARIDRSIVHRDFEIGVLRRVGMLQVLPVPVIESLADHATHSHVAEGQDVVRQGDPGDTFYVIAAGSAIVIQDGAVIARMRHGDCFGEIALLQSTPRTATVHAESDLSLYEIGSDAFLSAIEAYSGSYLAAQSLVRERVAVSARAEQAAQPNAGAVGAAAPAELG